MDDNKLFAKNETLIQTMTIYRQDIGIEFGIKKCDMVIMKSGKRLMIDGLELPNQEKIKKLGEK